MDALITELGELLTQEIALHKHLLALLHKEKEFLIDLSTEEILENTKKKETCTLKIKMLEESRSVVVKQLSQHCDVPSEELTLSKIVSLLKEPQRSTLDDTRSTLTSLIESIQEANQHNCLVVKDALHYCRRSLDFLYSSSAASPTYVHGGRIKDTARFGSLLSKEI